MAIEITRTFLVSARADDGDVIFTDPYMSAFSYIGEDEIGRTLNESLMAVVSSNCDGYENFKGKLQVSIKVIDE